MASIQNKDHWYDGWIYDALVAPLLDGLFRQVADMVEPGARVVDIGCGTGRLPLALAAKCGMVLGVDLSRRNIDRANLALARRPRGNVSFLHADAAAALAGAGRFDYAVMTFMLHEAGPEERLELLRRAARAADKVIVGDYLVPASGPLLGALAEAVEFSAGAEHYRNYRDFVRGGGISGLAARAGLGIVREVKNKPPVSHLALLALAPGRPV